MSDVSKPFWEKPLAELNDEQWEQLCDGCGRCCLKKLEDEDSAEVLYTSVVCHYFDEDSGSCNCYPRRSELVPDCLSVRNMELENVKWMPGSCAYRLRYDNKPLYSWHPLIAGSRQRMEEEGICIQGKVISEEFVHPQGLEEHIIQWVGS